MDIKQESKFVQFVKKYGVYVMASVVVVVLAITLGVIAAVNTNQVKETSTNNLEFGLPMTEATVIKDYSDQRLQYNPTLERWEAHFAIDFTADDLSVYSILDGKVLSAEYKYLEGYVVTIEHSDGFVSSYASLGENLEVKEGDEVKKGQKIGQASSVSASESSYGDHLEFKLMKDGKTIDPNDYLALENK